MPACLMLDVVRAPAMPAPAFAVSVQAAQAYGATTPRQERMSNHTITEITTDRIGFYYMHVMRELRSPRNHHTHGETYRRGGLGWEVPRPTWGRICYAARGTRKWFFRNSNVGRGEWVGWEFDNTLGYPGEGPVGGVSRAWNKEENREKGGEGTDALYYECLRRRIISSDRKCGDRTERTTRNKRDRTVRQTATNVLEGTRD